MRTSGIIGTKRGYIDKHYHPVLLDLIKSIDDPTSEIRANYFKFGFYIIQTFLL